jgi:hypothetical protein
MALYRDSSMKAAIMHVNGGQMFDTIPENSKFRAHNQHCWFIPLIVDYFPEYRHGIFINPTFRDGIKSRFPTSIYLKIPNPTWILDASRKTGTGPSCWWGEFLHFEHSHRIWLKFNTLKWFNIRRKFYLAKIERRRTFKDPGWIRTVNFLRLTAEHANPLCGHRNAYCGQKYQCGEYCF